MKTSDTSDVSVIVPVFNRARTVLATLDAVASQTRPPRLLVVVDDGSEDGTNASVRSWADRRQPPFEVRVLTGKRSGAGAARNRGMREAPDAGFLAFLDSDDLWEPRFLECTREAFVGREDAVAVTCDQRLERLHRGDRRREGVASIATDATRWLLIKGAGIASASLVRGEAARSVGGFPEDLPTGQDLAFFLGISRQGEWLHVPEPLVSMRRGHALDAGEHQNLSRIFRDRQRRWVMVAEAFLASDDGEAFRRDASVRRAVAERWRRAGRDSFRDGYPDEARDCFRRSCAWTRWNRAWIGLARAHVSGRIPGRG